jgi:transcriptional regulator with GAF, ATPase, and Fis domain
MNSEKKKGLEETIKEKVSSLLESTMEKQWGITIPQIETDITDKLNHPQLNIYVSPELDFVGAKKMFKKEFLKKEIKLHKGNISHLAKSLGLDRRSIHRAIKDLDIDMNKLRHQQESKEEYQQEMINKTIKSTLDQYKEIIRPQQMEKVYQEVPQLSRNIAKFIPLQELTWKEAEHEFEKQFLQHALGENKSITKTAEKLKIRLETLSRKIKKLGIKI